MKENMNIMVDIVATGLIMDSMTPGKDLSLIRGEVVHSSNKKKYSTLKFIVKKTCFLS